MSTKTPDFDEMSLDELIEWRTERKLELNKIHDQLRSSNESYSKKTAEAIDEPRPDGVVVEPRPVGQ